MGYKEGRNNYGTNNKISIAVTCVLLAIVVVLAVLVFIKDSNENDGPPEPTNNNIIIYSPGNTFENTLTPTEESSATPSFESPQITGKTTSPVQTPVPVYEFGQPVPANTPVNDGYFNDAIFIGDSRMEDIGLFSGAAKYATFYTKVGAVINYLIGKDYSELTKFTVNGEKLSLEEALIKYNNFSKVYIMMGFNELGWPGTASFEQYYTRLLKRIQEIQPKATIYVMSVIPVARNITGSGVKPEYENNERIAEFNSVIQKICADNKFHFLDVKEELVDSEGYLPDGTAADGIHMNRDYCIKCFDYIKRHTI